MEKSKHLVADIPVKAFIQKDGKFLLVEEMKGRSGWALPGGRINEGETPIEALHREMREELGIEVIAGKVIDCELFQSKSGMYHLVVVFDCTLDAAAEPAADGEELKSVKWVTLEEALGMELREEYRKIFERLTNQIPR